MKKQFFWIVLGLIFVWEAIQYWPVTVHINGEGSRKNFSIRMPLKDKRKLDYFFREVYFLNAWAYTLMGSKPVSTYQYKKPLTAIRYVIEHSELKDILLDSFWPPNFWKICYLLNPEQIRIKSGWDTLNKYVSYFPDSRFVLCTYPLENDKVVVLGIIDKIKLIKAIEKNLDDFQEVLNKQSVSLNDLLDNKKLYLFIKNLQRDELFGTILGFGRDNAKLFQKYRNMALEEWPLVSAWAAEEESYLKQITQKTLSFKSWDISDLFYPPFACILESEETKQLKQIYRKEREEIIKYYEGKDVVEASLSLMCRT